MSNTLLTQLEQRLAHLDVNGLRRQRRVTESPCAPDLLLESRRMLAFCSNDYLGLASHPQVIAAMQEGAARYGAGSGASHLISGHSRAHAELEARLATFLQPVLVEGEVLTFSTGYMANLAVLSAMADRDSALFSESLNHASLIDGARLSRATVHVYPHRDLIQLDALLTASNAATKLVVTDSVFSMDGDLAPLAEILTLCQRHDAWLVVDDAHGFGLLGQHGRGALEHAGVRSSRIIYMGTLGKAAGVSGAFVAAHKSVIDWLVQRARPYIYTTAAPPALAHALLSSLDIISGAEGTQRRTHLAALVQQFRGALRLQRWQNPASDTAIQPIIIGSNAGTMLAAATLQSAGLWVGAIRPPTVAVGTSRLRITLSAAHTTEHVARLCDELNRIESEVAT